MRRLAPLLLAGLAAAVLFVMPVECVGGCSDFVDRPGHCEMAGCSSWFGLVDYPGSVHAISGLFPLAAAVLLLAAVMVFLGRRRGATPRQRV